MTELLGITWDHPRGYAPLEASTERYFEQAGVRVTWHRRTLKDFGDVSVQALARKYDLLVIDHPHMGSVDKSGCLVNLNNQLETDELNLYKAESVGPSFDSYNYNGNQYAIPVDAACQTAAYRPDLLSPALLPATWQQVKSLSDLLKPKKQFIATALCPTDCNCIFLTLSAQSGNAAGQNGYELIAVEEGVKILNLMTALKNASHPESLNWNPIKLYDNMAANDDVVYSPLAFAYINYTVAGNTNKQLKFAHIPGGGTHSLLGGAGMAVSANSKYITDAVKYLKWVCGAEYQKNHYVREGGQPGQLSAWMDKQNDELSGSFFTSVLPTINTAHVRPRFPLWPQYQEMVGDVIHEYIAKNSNPVTIIKKLNNEYKKILA